MPANLTASAEARKRFGCSAIHTNAVSRETLSAHSVVVFRFDGVKTLEFGWVGEIVRGHVDLFVDGKGV